MLDSKHLAVVKDNLLLRYLVSQGGQLTMTYDAMQELAREYDGYAVYLACGPETFTVTVQSPERVRMER